MGRGGKPGGLWALRAGAAVCPPAAEAQLLTKPSPGTVALSRGLGEIELTKTPLAWRKSAGVLVPVPHSKGFLLRLTLPGLSPGPLRRAGFELLLVALAGLCSAPAASLGASSIPTDSLFLLLLTHFPVWSCWRLSLQIRFPSKDKVWHEPFWWQLLPGDAAWWQLLEREKGLKQQTKKKWKA